METLELSEGLIGLVFGGASLLLVIVRNEVFKFAELCAFDIIVLLSARLVFCLNLDEFSTRAELGSL